MSQVTVAGASDSLDMNVLRRCAEHALALDPQKGEADLSDADLRRQFHELQVSQIELEMQNRAMIELHQVKQVIKEGLDRYSDLYEFAPAGYFTLNRNGKIDEVNQSGANLLGLNRKKLIGKTFASLTPAENRPAFARFLAGVFVSPSKCVCEIQLRNANKDLIFFHVEACHDETGQVCRVMLVDITERKRSEEILRHAQNILTRAQQIAHVGSWELSLETREFEWSDEIFRIYGLEPQSFKPTLQLIFDFIHPDDLETVKSVLETAIMQRKSFAVEKRIVRPDGALRYLRCNADIVFDERSQTDSMVGCTFDITEQKLNELALREAHDELEIRVRERTTELLKANVLLKQEIEERKKIEAALDQSQRLAYTTIESLDAHILVLDKRGRVLSMNKSWCDFTHSDGIMFNYLGVVDAASGSNLVRSDGEGGAGKHFGVDPDNAIAFAEGIRAVTLGQRKSFAMDYPSDFAGVQYWFSGKVTRFPGPGPVRVVVSHEDITGQKRTEEALRLSHVQLRKLSAHLESIKENERKRIAREIHDELGQNLLALKIDVSMLHARTGANHPILHNRAGAVLGHVDQTIKNVRAIMNNLRPAVLDLGTKAAFEWQVKEFEQRNGIACKLTLDDAWIEPEEHRDTALFRILQESLTNIARHAKATKVNIALNLVDRHIVLRVADNGIGLHPGRKKKKDSFGLLGIKERAEGLGGELEIDGAPGGGVVLLVTLPVDANGLLTKPGSDEKTITLWEKFFRFF